MKMLRFYVKCVKPVCSFCHHFSMTKMKPQPSVSTGSACQSRKNVPCNQPNIRRPVTHAGKEQCPPSRIRRSASDSLALARWSRSADPRRLELLFFLSDAPDHCLTPSSHASRPHPDTLLKHCRAWMAECDGGMTPVVQGTRTTTPHTHNDEKNPCSSTMPFYTNTTHHPHPPH